ncbi:hypothetical protein BGX26_008664, partial [Mortierella sp. AD094]
MSHVPQVDSLGIIDKAPWNLGLADTLLPLDQSEDSPQIEDEFGGASPPYTDQSEDSPLTTDDEFDGVSPPYSQVPISLILVDSATQTPIQDDHYGVLFPIHTGLIDSTSSRVICRDSLSPLSQLDEESDFDPSHLKHITSLPFGYQWSDINAKAPMSSDFVNSV